MNLSPMNSEHIEEKEIPSPMVVCENCGISRVSHRMINFAIVIGSPGHESLPPFQCNAKQVDVNTSFHALGHWGCSEECLEVIMQACLSQHMIPALRNLRGTIDKELLQ